MPDLVTSLGLVSIVLGILLLHRVFIQSRRGHLPPGPKGLPLIGNVFDMPKSKEWLTFAKWGEQWGEIVCVTLMGQSVIILSSMTAATELLAKRSSIYSDRPIFTMGGELVGWNRALLLVPYGDRFRAFRRFLSPLLGGQQQVKQFHPLLHEETLKFVRRVLHDPADLDAHTRKTSGSTILKISHGYTVKEGHDPYVELVDTAMGRAAGFVQPGTYLVDIIPALRHLPSWFPGAGFKKFAASCSKELNDLADIPYNFVKEQMENGTEIPNFTSRLLQSEDLTPEKEFNIKWCAASLYSGGADTTVSSVYSFFLIMTLYPEVQRKAQEEIDRVVGNERLPTLDDRENLPYVDALVKELFRCKPVTPLGGSHRLMRDDEYQGYFIPKGSIVVANVWKLLHDPERYHDPMVFNPSRFLPSEGKPAEFNPKEICFGFGRRICPGMYLADAAVFLSCAMSLAVFNIAKCVESGKVVEPIDDCTNGAVVHPVPFKCSVTPRSIKARELILGTQGPEQP